MMFRLFCMDRFGRMFQLGSLGWTRKDGTSFSSIEDIREFLRTRIIPALPGELDAFIADIESNGRILQTFPIMEG